MSEFIKLRESIAKHDNKNDFSQVLLNEVMSRKEKSSPEALLFKQRFDLIIDLNNQNELQETQILELISFLGENPYIDRYAVETILQSHRLISDDGMKKIIKEEMTKQSVNNKKIYHLLDLALELNFDIFPMEYITSLLEKSENDIDLVSLILEYIGQFKLAVEKEFLYEQLKLNYPKTIKVTIIELMDELFSVNELDMNLIREDFKDEHNLVFLNDYIDFLKDKQQRTKNGTVILQSMFYGDFEDSGKGNNGGLAILLKTLGNEISIDERIDLVMTITISDDMSKPFMVYYEDNHLFVRLPAYLDRTVSDPFLKRELFIKRYINKYLIKLNIQPDVFHIRYLDNASMAVAKLSQELKEKLVLTLAPDPHRNMSDETGILKSFAFEELQILTNKIKIGDKLICMSDKILGIGGKKVKKELLLYFPQFSHHSIEHKIKMIDEGIKTDEDMFKHGEEVDVCNLDELIGIHPSFCEKPVILNVGRLAGIKGQVALFEAWSTSKLKETHNLLIIGGDLEYPNQEEKSIIDYFNSQINQFPELRGRFFHKRAMHNDKIKQVEKSIMKRSFELPHVYLASSLKEEFGIAILEAMSRGFLILAPIKGGVKSYITSGDNGFLIDTSSYKTIVHDAEKILYNSDYNKETFNEIQQAGKKTIEDNFSIDKIAKNFTDTYLSLFEGENNEL